MTNSKTELNVDVGARICVELAIFDVQLDPWDHCRVVPAVQTYSTLGALTTDCAVVSFCAGSAALVSLASSKAFVDWHSSGSVVVD